jgi:hypothetical protein
MSSSAITRACALLFATLLAASMLLWPVAAAAQAESDALSPAEVVQMGPAEDGSRVVIEGEAVGDVLRAMGGGKWVNVLGDEVGIGVWMTDEMVERIEHFGHYQHSGDMVRVTGTLNRTCPEHSGEFDIHAEELEVLSAGEPIEHVSSMSSAIVGVVGIVIGAGLLYRFRKLRD